MSTLHEFDGREKLVVSLGQPIVHPTRRERMGRWGRNDKGEPCAVFPRNPQEHKWWKNKGFDEGYLISVPLLDLMKQRGVDTIYFAEDGDERRVLEYDLQTYLSGGLFAYSPSENRAVVGEDAVEQADASVYTDRQRHVPDEQILRVWNRGEFEFK